MLRHLPVFAMQRDEIPRPHQVQNQLQLFHARVPGNVYRRIHRTINQIRPTLGHVVHHPVNRFLIARNNTRTQHHRVAALHRQALVLIHRHARQSRHRFALRSRNHHAHLSRRRRHNVLRAKQNVVRNRQQPKIVGNLGHVVHAAAQERHLAPELGRKIQNLLQPVNRRTEARDHHAPFRPVENIFQPRPHRAFALGITRPVDVGRIRHQQQHAALPIIGKRMQIEQLVVGRSRVHLEVARVDDHPKRRSDRHRHRAHNRVRHPDELHHKRPEFNLLPGLHPLQHRRFIQVVLFKPPFHQRQREVGPIDRDVHLRQQERNSTDVVFVAVRQKKRPNHGPVFFQIREIGSYDIDA